MRTIQRTVSTLVLAVVGVCASCLLSNTAQAAVVYRYWTYWQVSNSQWMFAQAGPASITPANGSVEGWRFGISSSSADQKMSPQFMASTAFEVICANETPPAGMKRVALVIDPGLPQHAPRGESPGVLFTQCVQIQESANGYDVLRQAQPVRTDNGLICAITDYPRQECAEAVDESAMQSSVVDVAAASHTPDSSSPLPLFVGALFISALGGLIWKLRRRA